jgi:hypothetical protein
MSQPLESTLHLIAVQWLEMVGEKCGAALVFKAEIAFDMSLGCPSEPQMYAVKQYSQQDKELYQQEINACAFFSKTEDNAALTECFGTFEDVDSEGHPTYNILLEISHSNLWDYWTNIPPPTTFNEISSFYSQLFKLTTGLNSLRKMRDTQDRSLEYILQTNVKPNNIQWFPGRKPGLTGAFKIDLRYQGFIYITKEYREVELYIEFRWVVCVIIDGENPSLTVMLPLTTSRNS